MTSKVIAFAYPEGDNRFKLHNAKQRPNPPIITTWTFLADAPSARHVSRKPDSQRRNPRGASFIG